MCQNLLNSLLNRLLSALRARNPVVYAKSRLQTAYSPILEFVVKLAQMFRADAFRDDTSLLGALPQVLQYVMEDDGVAIQLEVRLVVWARELERKLRIVVAK